MLISWLRNRRRRRLLAEPFPIRWEAILTRNVGHYPLLSPAEQARLRDTTRVLVTEKTWVGCGGLFVTEEMKVTVAAEASLLLLGIDRDYFRHVSSVVIHPAQIRTPVAEDGWEDDFLSDHESDGFAEYRGAVILSWEDVIAEARDPTCGDNLVIHEFAHQLDFLDDTVSGPPLGDPALESRWRYVMSVALNDLREAVRKGEETFFRDRAAENEAEFFADASEAFFCEPLAMREQYPDVYQLLGAYYRLDPTKWFPAEG